MELQAESIKELLGDAVLVRRSHGEETRRGFYVPVSCRDNRDERRRACWSAVVVKLGPRVDSERWKPYTIGVGDKVWLNPVAFDCPSFKDGQDKLYVVRDEDIEAVERN